ncbi:HAD superfamily hydrolase (TIGR01450 family) [Amycolatopsis bartoniae]|uniref:Acid sugar phosphatase n=1 Tax=Amycolatopsis bartoniae TaxID=941986 RepID=A0A8H9MEM4_9PSEU|nr:HAD-IIA family hydrolase [Amycolatopsis bartoniae]MBB2936377.1 HAD superfamily hydrolase (TIGR01450 family) [Amycolatopsis bartoniae]TVS98960.1 HAD-IIA family hydrolase [Amycolatopsis bartoniae]GHF89584.1 acid sugar phosphatase [Amycolatopsis bartoniae]
MTDGEGLAAGYDVLLFDLDGTVYHGPQPIPGVAEAIRGLRARGIAVRFVTNNASRAPGDVAATLRGMEIDAETAEVSTSAQAAAKILGDRLPPAAQVLVVGAPALEAEVQAAGLTPVREVSPDVAAVVQGHWTETGWKHLAEACLAIRAGALWVASNVDATLPTERGLLPGNGSMVAALKTATNTEPVVAGKPEAPLFHTATQSAGATKPLAIGDRLDTDIAGANTAGVDSLLVLTGVSTAADVLAAVPAERPTYLAADLGALDQPADDLTPGPQKGWQVDVDGDTLVASGKGSSDAYALLRALCHEAWQSGVTDVRAQDDLAAKALTELGLPSSR